MSDLTPERLTELRRIAEAATPGPLRDAVLEMIDEIFRLRHSRAEVVEMREAARRQRDEMLRKLQNAYAENRRLRQEVDVLREVASRYEPCGTCGETQTWCGCGGGGA